MDIWVNDSCRLCYFSSINAKAELIDNELQEMLAPNAFKDAMDEFTSKNGRLSYSDEEDEGGEDVGEGA